MVEFDDCGNVVVDYLGRVVGKFNPRDKVFLARRSFKRHVFQVLFPFSLGCSFEVLLRLRGWGCRSMRFTVVRDDKVPVVEELWVTNYDVFLDEKRSRVYNDGGDVQRVLNCHHFKRFVGDVVVDSFKDLREQKTINDGFVCVTLDKSLARLRKSRNSCSDERLGVLGRLRRDCERKRLVVRRRKLAKSKVDVSSKQSSLKEVV